MREPQPTFDGERIARERLAKAFQSPPGLPTFPPSRSTLLVGARGSGKTTLLKHTEARQNGSAVYCDLRTVFNELSADTGAAGLSFDNIAGSSEGLIQDKAIAILISAISRRLVAKLSLVNDPHLFDALSHLVHFFPEKKSTDPAWIYRNLATLEPSRFRTRPNLANLEDYLESMNAVVQQRTGSNLLLLIDRAEEIPYPALTPVLQLLDQSRSFQTIVATRPGMIGLSNNTYFSLPRPGDHYDIYHLGAHPYSEDWGRFQRQVLSAWMPKTLDSIPPDSLSTTLRISRDSLRCMLELAYHSTDDEGKFSRPRSVEAAQNLQRMILDAANGAARSVGADLMQITNTIRKEFRNSRLPVALRLLRETVSPADRQLSFLPDSKGEQTLDARSERFVRLALRTWFFSTLHGKTWNPMTIPDSVEINPIFLWYPSSKWHPMPTITPGARKQRNSAK